MGWDWESDPLWEIYAKWVLASILAWLSGEDSNDLWLTVYLVLHAGSKNNSDLALKQTMLMGRGSKV